MSRRLLLRTIRLARSVGQVVVVSRDRTVRQLAKQAGAWALVESGDDLNQAVGQASRWITARDGRAVLILPNDLPVLRSADLTQLVELGQPEPSLVIAPCHRNSGTNALLMRPPGLIGAAFGPRSFEAHRQAATAAGVEPSIFRSPTVSFDLDSPEDLTRLPVEARKF